MKIFNDALRAIQNTLNNDRYCFNNVMAINEYAHRHKRSDEFVDKYRGGDKNAIRNLFLLARIDYRIEKNVFVSDEDLDIAIRQVEVALDND